MNGRRISRERAPEALLHQLLLNDTTVLTRVCGMRRSSKESLLSSSLSPRAVKAGGTGSLATQGSSRWLPSTAPTEPLAVHRSYPLLPAASSCGNWNTYRPARSVTSNCSLPEAVTARPEVCGHRVTAQPMHRHEQHWRRKRAVFGSVGISVPIVQTVRKLGCKWKGVYS